MLVDQMIVTPVVHAAQDLLHAETKTEIAIEKESKMSTPAARPLADAHHPAILHPSVARHLQFAVRLLDMTHTGLGGEKVEAVTYRLI